MAHYKVILAYDGTDFQGFQRQGEGQPKDQRTIQAEVEAALRQLGWQAGSVLFAGRTDTGVHATGQVIAFELDWLHSPQELGRAMNANLPRDIAVKSVSETTAGFHPRFDARLRTYTYRIYCEPERDPLLDRFTWRVWPPVDDERLERAAKLLPGTHDFAAFGAPPRTGGSTQRTVYRAAWNQEEDVRFFEVSANAFLYHMVRRMVYLQVLAGQAKIGLGELEMAVEHAKPMPPGLAPAHGLILTDVHYELTEQEIRLLPEWQQIAVRKAAAETALNIDFASGEDDRGKDLRH